jgi:outer membrane receptor protein involved in Fe transport
VLAAAPVLAAESCDLQLEEASKHYRSGSFNRALEYVEACLNGRPSHSERARSYALLAQIYLAVDDVERALPMIESLLEADPTYVPAHGEPLVFVDLVTRARLRRAAKTVSAASKLGDAQLQTPVSAAIVTAAEIRRRGYLDLAAVLHDLPGFDLVRGNGEIYTSIYQRGLRSDGNQHALLLVDGIEQNHLMTGTAYLSRQYPLSSIRRIEVVYGPLSAVYGANGYTGVVNIITREPDALVRQDRRFGFEVLAGGGSFATRYLDFTIAGISRNEGVSWSLTGRTYRSDEHDLSEHASDWPYIDPALVDSFGYEDLGITGDLVQRARDHDRAVISRGNRSGFPERFADETEGQLLYGKLRLKNLRLGLMMWRLAEGAMPWYTGATERTPVGARWSPQQLALSAEYSRQIGESFKLRLVSCFLKHGLGRDSATAWPLTFGDYYGVNRYLEGLDQGLPWLLANGTPLQLLTVRREERATQFRSELDLLWRPSAKLTAAFGVESRFSTRQIDLSTATDAVSELTLYQQQPRVDETNLGLFAQASYTISPQLVAFLGGRFDQLQTSGIIEQSYEADDSVSVFSPWLALIYSPEGWSFKASYSEGFRQPSAYERYSRQEVGEDLRDPAYLVGDGLSIENAKSFELSAAWHPDDRLTLELAAYQATYSELVSLRRSGDDGSTTFTNDGSVQVHGLQLVSRYRFRSFDLFGNYSFTEPSAGSPLLDDSAALRVGDIAQHRLNLGVNTLLAERFNLNLRVSYVGARRAAMAAPFATVDAHVVANLALTYHDILPGASLQLTVDNLLDSQYQHPGVRQADGARYARVLPQPGRSLFLRLVYRH